MTFDELLEQVIDFLKRQGLCIPIRLSQFISKNREHVLDYLVSSLEVLRSPLSNSETIAMRYIFANCALDTQRGIIRNGAQERTLAKRPFEILCYLLQHANRSVSRQELVEQFWTDKNPTEATLLRTMRTVRRSIGDNLRNPRIIQYDAKQGYRLAVTVTVIAEEDGVAACNGRAAEAITRAADINGAALEDEIAPPQRLSSSPTALAPRALVRRQLSVLFCDFAVSANALSPVDPEDHLEVVQTCHDAIAPIIAQYEGHIVKSLGDGLLIYFGYPQAHEDDALRAASCALGILEHMAQLRGSLSKDYGAQVTAQIGIHTGLAVASDQRLGSQTESLALGEVPSLAVRLQALLEPNTIGISAATYHLVRGAVLCHALGPQAIRGLPEAIEVYQMLRLRRDQSRFGVAMMTRELMPLVGRERELAFLRGQWEQARSGVGSVVSIRGDAGIGKSRLVRMLKEQIVSDAHMILECQGSPYYQRTAFWPLTQWLGALCQWEEGETSDIKLKKLETALAQFMLPREETLALFAELLSLTPRDGKEALRHMYAGQRRHRIMESLLTILFELTRQGPIVLVTEDLQWMDASTLELMSLLANHVPRTRMLVLFIARSEFEMSLNAQLPIPDLRLDPLTSEQVERMILQLTQEKGLPAELLQQIVAKADGIPLFVEEMTHMVLDSGWVVERDDSYELRDDLPDLPIPGSLRNALIARLDRLAVGQETAQVAAVIGRDFSYPLIRAVVTLSESTLQRELAHLVESDLLHQSGLPPNALYQFKHALIQEAAYQALSRDIRRQLHRQIACALGTAFPETCASQPELLAHHYAEAGLPQQAVLHWRQAAQQASDRSAFADAQAHAQQGLAALATLPANTERFQQELDFHILLSKLPYRTQHDVVHSSFQRAYELAKQFGNLSQRFDAFDSLSYGHLTQGKLVSAYQFGAESLDLARRTDDPMRLRKSHRNIATALFFIGDQTKTIHHLSQALPENWAPLPFALMSQHHQVAEAAILRYKAWAQWLLGFPEQASRTIERATQLSQGNVLSLGVDMFFSLVLHQWLGEVDAIHMKVNILLDYSQANTIPSLRIRGSILKGWSLVQQGQQTAGIDLVQRSIAEYRTIMGYELFLTYFLALLAELYGQSGDIEAGLNTVSEALALAHQNNERFWEADLFRLRASLLLQQVVPDIDKAEDALQQSLIVARQQQVQSLELRATTSLTRLWQREERRRQALHQLETIYSAFTEGHDTADLRDARSLLDESKNISIYNK